MDKSNNSMLAILLAILEKLDENYVVAVERQDNNLIVRKRDGKQFNVEIPIPKDGVNGKDADVELIQNNVVELITTHVDSHLKEIEIKSLSEATQKFRHDQDNVISVVNEKITTIENKLTKNVEVINYNLDSTKKNLVKDINNKLNKVRNDIEEIKAVKVTNGIDGKNGKDGINGKDGNGILNAKIDERGHLIIVTNEKTYDLGSIRRKGGSGGGGGAATAVFTYTNSTPMPQDVGGLLAGTTFSKVPLNELWTRLLYPYQFPEFSDFSINLSSAYEVGDIITVGNYQTTWAIDNVEMLENNTISIKYMNTNTFLANNLANIVPYYLDIPNITYSIPTDVVFTISALNSTEASFSRNFSVQFMQRTYIGESDLDVLTEADIKGLRLSELKTNINGDYEMLAGGYKWFCYPESMGTRNNFYDLDNNLHVAMNSVQIVTITNDFGVTADYYCYRTFNMLGGAINIGIS